MLREFHDRYHCGTAYPPDIPERLINREQGRRVAQAIVTHIYRSEFKAIAEASILGHTISFDVKQAERIREKIAKFIVEVLLDEATASINRDQSADA